MKKRDHDMKKRDDILYGLWHIYSNLPSFKYYPVANNRVFEKFS